MSHLLSLAAGVLPEFPPDRIVQAAAEAGYRATGIWCDTETWTDKTTREVHRQLRNGALQALDIEVIWIRPGREVTDSCAAADRDRWRTGRAECADSKR